MRKILAVLGAIALAWSNAAWADPMVQAGGGGSGGGGWGGAVTIADCADVTQGCEADAAWVSGSGTVISLLKKIAGAGSGSNASVGTIGATAPTSATYFGMLVAGNLTGVPGSANGVLVDSTTLATVANQPTKAAQGSTTSGETGTLGMTATTTAAPTYTTAQTNPLSTTPTGDLRAFDTTVAADIVSGQCTQPCPVKQLGDQSTYEAIGGTGNAALTNTAGALQILTQANNLMRIECWNPNTTPVFLQLFDSATSITLGTTIPTKSIECPAGNGTQDGIYDHEYNGIKFTAGLRVVATTTRTGSTAPTTAVPASIGYALGN